MGMHYAPLPSGVLIAVRRSRSGIEIYAQEGLSAATVARAVANMLGFEQNHDGQYRALSVNFCKTVPVTSQRAS